MADEQLSEEYGGRDETVKYSKITVERDERTGSRENNNKWNNEQTENRRKTTSDAGLSDENEGTTNSNGRYNPKINRNNENVENPCKRSFLCKKISKKNR